MCGVVHSITIFCCCLLSEVFGVSQFLLYRKGTISVNYDGMTGMTFLVVMALKQAYIESASSL